MKEEFHFHPIIIIKKTYKYLFSKKPFSHKFALRICSEKFATINLLHKFSTLKIVLGEISSFAKLVVSKAILTQIDSRDILIEDLFFNYL